MMAPLTQLSTFLTLLLSSLLILPTHALYFYIDGTTPKCFYEELPKDTLVVGPSSFFESPTSYFIPTNLP